MQKRKIWENFLQWVLPCVLLVIALVLSIYDFNNKMDAAIQTVVDDQAEQIGLYYAAGVEESAGKYHGCGCVDHGEPPGQK